VNACGATTLFGENGAPKSMLKQCSIKIESICILKNLLFLLIVLCWTLQMVKNVTSIRI